MVEVEVSAPEQAGKERSTGYFEIILGYQRGEGYFATTLVVNTTKWHKLTCCIVTLRFLV